MTTLEIIETGEVIAEMTEEEASSVTTRISVKLDNMADNFESAMPLIREALTRRAFAALGYASPGAYVADRFGNALARLGADMRREVVRELTEAGLSTRAIAPVVGVSPRQIVTDQRAGVNSLHTSPAEVAEADPAERSGQAESEALQRIDPDEEPLIDEQCEAIDAQSRTPVAPPDVVGIDGHRYPRPIPKPASAKPRQKPLAEVAKAKGFELRSGADAIKKLVEDPRFPQNAEQVATALRGHLLYVAETVAAVLDQLP